MSNNKIPTAEEVFKEEASKFREIDPFTEEGRIALNLLVINVANTHAKNHVEAALKEASENFVVDRYLEPYENEIKKSILNAYPLTNIK